MVQMKRNRKVRRMTANASIAAVMAAAIAGGAMLGAAAPAQAAGSNATAGVIRSLSEITTMAVTGVSVSEDGVAEVAAAAETEAPAAEEAPQAEYPEWENKLMANVDETLSVRADASTEAELVGKLRRGDVAEITGVADGWYQITSGNVAGFVSAEYSLIGDDAARFAEEVCTTYAVSTTDGLRIREEATAESSVIATLNTDERLAVNKEAEAVEGWVAVKTKSSEGYVSAEFVTVETEYGTGITVEEEQALIKAEQERQAAEAAAAAAAAAQSSQSTGAAASASVTPTQNAAVAASYDDVTYLAAIIQHEAGTVSWEGQCAVGAVVVNRMRSGSFPNTVYDVINQPGQFISTSSASMQRILQNGPAASCISAAQTALSGYDNTGGALSFRSARTGHAGVNIGGNVFF